MEETESISQPAPSRKYPSLYDTTENTFIAVGIGLFIIISIQLVVARMYQTAKSDHAYLTRFVTALVALVVGVYITDLLIAGPDTSLLADDEHDTILGFITDTCLMVFSYYFGLKAQTPKDVDLSSTETTHKPSEEGEV